MKVVSNSSFLWSPMVTTEATLGPVNLFMSPFDMPVILDIDNDGQPSIDWDNSRDWTTIEQFQTDFSSYEFWIVVSSFIFDEI